jgi:hypothetical protein
MYIGLKFASSLLYLGRIPINLGFINYLFSHPEPRFLGGVLLLALISEPFQMFLFVSRDIIAYFPFSDF